MCVTECLMDVPTLPQFLVALVEPGGAEQVLREGANGAPITHGAVSGLECAGQLRLRKQEEEEEKGSRIAL